MILAQENYSKKIRLNKYLALSGLGSRRSVEDFITSGRIKINGKTVKNLSTFIIPGRDSIEFDKKNISPIPVKYYILLNKPKGYISTIKDDRNRAIVMDLVPEMYFRKGVFPVGRLDKETEGILLFTNDGELAYLLTHPKYKIIKEYYVELSKPLDELVKSKIEKGIYLDGVKTQPARVEFTDESMKKLNMTLTEGKKRQIRNVFMRFGINVKMLKRTAFGPLKLKNLKKGNYRSLMKSEIAVLKKMAMNIAPHSR